MVTWLVVHSALPAHPGNERGASEEWREGQQTTGIKTVDEEISVGESRDLCLELIIISIPTSPPPKLCFCWMSTFGISLTCAQDG